ncbi:hypothetical protein KEF85_05985 [Methylomonas paludis]|uniref:Large polyvalent protein associated domain-containing protein n=1 Tax=Methylomonas paludis TaxID=1173101 RepID=A0A975RB51_9GAMM|nr:hypothetical protein [Methylomonas paludis]QWF72004.1 hypothetical protein KEF85_05985 [Methylomonas paludis]
MEPINPYWQAIQGEAAQNLRLSLQGALGKQPDQEAELQHLARRYQLPVDAVRQQRDSLQRRASLDNLDYQQLVQHSPVTSGFLSQPQQAAIGHDDIANLTALEQALRFGQHSAQALLSGVFGFGEGVAGQAEAGADLFSRYVTGPLAGPVLPVDITAPVAAAFRQIRRSQRDWRNYLTPPAQGNMQAGYYAGLQSLSQNVLTWPLALATDNPGLALRSMAGNSGGQAYGQARDQGLEAPQAALYGAGNAAIEYATEQLPLHSLFKDVKAGTPFFQLLTRQLAQEIPGEQAATALQDLNEWAVLHPQQTWQDYLAARPDAAWQTLVATAVAGGGQTGILHGAEAYSRMRQNQYSAAGRQAEQLQVINGLAAASKVLPRDPQAMQDFVAAVTQDQPVQHVYADAQTLQQSGLDKWLSAIFPPAARQMADALASGGEIRIPLSDYVSRVAAVPALAQALRAHLRVEGQAFSQAEAEQYHSRHAEELQAEVQRQLDYQQFEYSMKSATAAVQTRLQADFAAASPFSRHVNDNYAALVSHFYQVQAERFGISPEQLYQRYPLRLASDAGDGQSPAGADRSATVPRGSYRPDDYTITLHQAADLSTFLHEAAHFFLDVQFGLSRELQAGTTEPVLEAGTDQTDQAEQSAALHSGQQQLLADTRLLQDWLGIADTRDWFAQDFEQRRRHHERFARSFEAYLFAGKAPSLSLQALFERFRAWLLHIYTNLKNLGGAAPEPIRGVFSRMLASAEEIRLAEQARGMRPLFKSARPAGMTASQFSTYQALQRQAGQAANAALQKRVLGDMQWLSTAHSEILQALQDQHQQLRVGLSRTIQDEVLSHQLYMAWDILSDPNSDVKLSETEMRSRGIDPEIIGRLGRLGMTTAQAEWPLDAVAEWYDFSSGPALINALANGLPPQIAMTQALDWHMFQNYAEINDSTELRRAAWRALHNSLRGEVLAMEAVALAQLGGEIPILAADVRDYARSVVENTTLRQLRVGQYMWAETKAALAAERAWQAGDVQQAAIAKRRQLINFYAAEAAFQAEEVLSQALHYFQGFYNGHHELPEQTLAMLHETLSRAGVAAQMALPDDYDSLIEWVARQQSLGLWPEPPAQFVGVSLPRYLDMPVVQFKAYVDFIHTIQHIAELEAAQHWWQPGGTSRLPVLQQQLMHSIRDAYSLPEAMHRPALPPLRNMPLAASRIADWVGRLDAGDQNGPFRRLFLDTALRAAHQQGQRLAEQLPELSALLDNLLGGQQPEGKGQYFPSIQRSLTLEMRVILALHTGNQGGLQHVLAGEGWTAAQLNPVLDSLSGAQWQQIQQVWDFFAQFQPEIAARHRRLYGVEPQWLTLLPRRIRLHNAGVVEELTLAGGYYPLHLHPLYHKPGPDQDMTLLTRLSFFQPLPGSRRQRWPLLYSVSELFDGLNAIIHDLSWYETWLGMRQLLLYPPLRAEMTQHCDDENCLGEFEEYLQQIAAGSRRVAREAGLALARSQQYGFMLSMGVAVMETAFQRVINKAVLQNIEPEWLAGGIYAMLDNPQLLIPDIAFKSDQFTDRLFAHIFHLGDREKRQAKQIPGYTPSLPDAIAQLSISYAQLCTEMIVWWAVYQRALHNGANVEHSSQLADDFLAAHLPYNRKQPATPLLKRRVAEFYDYARTGLGLGMGQGVSEDQRAQLLAEYLCRFSLPLVFVPLLQRSLPETLDKAGWQELSRVALAHDFGELLPVLAVYKAFNANIQSQANLRKVLKPEDFSHLKTAGLERVLDPGSKSLVQFLLDTTFDNSFWYAVTARMGWAKPNE